MAISNLAVFADPIPEYTLVLVTQSELNLLRQIDRPTPRIFLSMEGGICQGASSNFNDGLDITILDYDEDDNLVTQSGGGITTASTYNMSPTFDPQWVSDDDVVVWSAGDAAMASAEGWELTNDFQILSIGDFETDEDAVAHVKMMKGGSDLHCKAWELAGDDE